MKVLVTGAGGFIGRCVTRFCETARHTVWPVRHTDFDLTDPDSVKQLRLGESEAIVHCAATRITGIAEHRADPAANLVGNLVMTARLIDAAARAGVGHFVFLSSSTVYPAFTPLVAYEEMTPCPDAIYEGIGGVKVYCEKLLAFYKRAFPRFNYTILRPTAVYGPGDKSSHVVPSLIRRALAGETPLHVWGSPDTVRDFVYVGDVAHAVIAALDRPPTGQIFNVGSGRATTMRELATIVKLAVDGEGPLRFDDLKPQAIPYRQVTIEKIRARLGWAPLVPLDAGIAETVEWSRR